MKNAHRILYKSVRNGALFCVVAATVEDERLAIHKVDFQEWENNRRDGTVEASYMFDEENTLKLYNLMQASTASDLITKLKKQFGFRTGMSDFITNLLEFCEDNGIKNDFNVFY